jgi:outer membrane protein assembly factor BamD (BamD/ComL family)
VTPPAAIAEPFARQPATETPPSAETELVLLRRARGALARNDADHALAAVERHRRLWPKGELVQEREVLAIQALSLAGATSRARARADRFLEHYPASTLAETVRQLRKRLAD